jgi:hypothetical protein
MNRTRQNRLQASYCLENQHLLLVSCYSTMLLPRNLVTSDLYSGGNSLKYRSGNPLS